LCAHEGGTFRRERERGKKKRMIPSELLGGLEYGIC
jgi:hypothetical protein